MSLGKIAKKTGKALAAGSLALVMSGCATKIVMTANDQCLVTAQDEQGNNILAPKVDKNCWKEKSQFHKQSLKREEKSQDVRVQLIATVQEQDAARVQKLEILKTYATAAQIGLKKGQLSLDNYEQVLHPMLREAASDPTSKAELEGLGVDIDRLKEEYKAHFEFAVDKCNAMAKPGVDVAVFSLEGYPTVVHVDRKSEPYGPCVEKNVQNPTPTGP